jgi:hypothetical protein
MRRQGVSLVHKEFTTSVVAEQFAGQSPYPISRMRQGRSRDMKAPPGDSKGKKGPGKDPETWGDHQIFDPTWLEGRSPEELVRIILQLKNRMPAKPTAQLDLLTAFAVRDAKTFGAGAKAKVERYVQLPVARPGRDKDAADAIWRLALISSNSRHDPLGLEIHGDVVVGRAAPDIAPDLDLIGYDGEEYGVSRRHAIFRPTRTHLYLIDLHSTNGTYHNGFRLSSGKAQELTDNDFISFGKLHFTISLVRQPPGQEATTIHHNGKLKIPDSG